MEVDLIIEQRVIIEFLIKLGKINAEICAMLLAVYGAAMIKHSVMYEWIGRFRERKEMW